VSADPVALGLDAQVLADQLRADHLLGRGAGEVDGLGAGLIDLAGARTERAHVK
jgi:hypothetical protein